MKTGSLYSMQRFFVSVSIETECCRCQEDVHIGLGQSSRTTQNSASDHAAGTLICVYTFKEELASSWQASCPTMRTRLRTHPPMPFPYYCFTFCSSPLFFKNSLHRVSVAAYSQGHFETRELTNCMKSSSSFEPALMGGLCSLTFFSPRKASVAPAKVVPRVSIASCDCDEQLAALRRRLQIAGKGGVEACDVAGKLTTWEPT